MTDLEDAEARPRDDQHAGKAGEDRQPAPPAGPFAEQRPGKRGDHHRREEKDRRRLGELQRVQRQEIEEGRAEQEDAAQHLHAAGFVARNIAGFCQPRNRISTSTTCTANRIQTRTAPPCRTSTRYFALVSRKENRMPAPNIKQDRRDGRGGFRRALWVVKDRAGE